MELLNDKNTYEQISQQTIKKQRHFQYVLLN